jgi:hypothetical protein
MAARQQLEQMRGRALPAGSAPGDNVESPHVRGTGQYL